MSDRSEYFRKYRETHQEQRVKACREWRKSNPDYHKKWNQTHPKAITAYCRKWLSLNPAYAAKALPAQRAVNRAIKKGILIREPCSVCSNPKTEAHHFDYTKPLEVIWLCVHHHKQHHKIEKHIK